VQQETLEDLLRRVTRNFSQRISEDEVLRLGADLAAELARAHSESPPRHPEIEPSAIAMASGKPRLDGGTVEGDDAEDLFHLGALLGSLASGGAAQISWRLDGPPPPQVSTVKRRAALAGLAAPRRGDRFRSAAEAKTALLEALAPSAEDSSPWPCFRGSDARSGAGPGRTPEELEPAWEVALGAVVASPVLAAGHLVVPTSDGRLVFVDPGSGRRLHELRLASAVESSPAVGDGRLHVGTDDGDIVGVDAIEGRERYRTKVGRLVRSSPLVMEDRLVAGVVEARNAGQVVGLDPRTGMVWWSRRLAAVFSSPARAGDRVLIGSDDGSLHALDAARGGILWSHALGAKVRATPAVAGGLVLAADFEGRVVAVRVADGTRVWLHELGHTVYSSPCVAGDLCVVGCHEGHVHGLSLETGEPRFEVRTRGPVVASPVAAGERFLVGSTDGDLYLIDRAGGVAQRTRLSGQGIQSSAALNGAGTAFVGSGTGLHALRLRP